MTDFNSMAPFMNDFEQEILDIHSFNKIIDLTCYHIEGLEVDEATNLLIALKLLLKNKEDNLYNFFQKAWKEFMVPAHQKSYLPNKTWRVEMGPNGLITFPDDLVKEVGFEEWDLVDVYIDKSTRALVIKKLEETEENYPEGIGCMGDTLTDEELESIKEKGVMSLKSPWD